MTTENDLKKYIKKTIWSASFLAGAISLAVLCAHFFGAMQFFDPLLGALIGVVCATLNVFAIGYSFYVVAIRDGRKRVLLIPLASFIAMCGIAYVLANYWTTLILGFALGLTAPLLFGAVVIF